MNKIRILRVLIFLYMFLNKVNCESNAQRDSKIYLPYFRKQAEEVDEDRNIARTTDENDPDLKFVSIMVNNPKELFDDFMDDLIGRNEIIKHKPKPINRGSSKVYETPPRTAALKKTTPMFTSESNTNDIDIKTPEKESKLAAEINHRPLTADVGDKFYNNLTNTPRNNDKLPLAYISKSQNNPNINSAINPLDIESKKSSKRLCIMCNNVASEECNSPKGHAIPSKKCERDDDMCYSMHTPFGIVDRGCFNKNHDLTTYVCSCNLCNTIPISEMPHNFETTHEWIDNVVDISHKRSLRKSVGRSMSCLRCEANATDEVRNDVDRARCLNGKIAELPAEVCDENEVCAVRAQQADGYIWRGCVKAPLYNYWWALCTEDLCNSDSIMSLYDFY